MVKRNWSGGGGAVDQMITFILQLLKLLITKNLVLSICVFLEKNIQIAWHINIIGHININSIRNKFYYLIAITKGNVDVLMISETKLDESFPSMHFNIDRYSIFRSDRNPKGGGMCGKVFHVS